MINESGTMSGGGGKPRGGRMCIGSAAPKPVDGKAAAAELAAAELELNASMQAGRGARRGEGHAGGHALCWLGAPQSLLSRFKALELRPEHCVWPPCAVQALQDARQQLAQAAAEAKQAERALADLETAIPKASLHSRLGLRQLG